MRLMTMQILNLKIINKKQIKNLINYNRLIINFKNLYNRFKKNCKLQQKILRKHLRKKKISWLN